MTDELKRLRARDSDGVPGFSDSRESSPTADKFFLTRILERSPSIVYVYDLHRNRHIFSNRDIFQVLGFNAEETNCLKPTLLTDLMHPEDATHLGEYEQRLLEAKDDESVSFEYRMRDSMGRWRWLLSHDAVFERDPEGRPVSKVGITEDITERKMHEQFLIQAARVDELTGLYNRRGFDDIAAQHIALARRRKTSLMLMYFDVDDFKLINDTYGHAEGDRALKGVALFLRTVFRSSDTIARIGGDEFAVLLFDAPATSAALLLERFRAEVHQWNTVNKKEWPISLSAGCAAFDPAEPEDLERLLSRADKDMYANKQHKHRTSED